MPYYVFKRLIRDKKIRSDVIKALPEEKTAT
jgi:hypothetical protein